MKALFLFFICLLFTQVWCKKKNQIIVLDDSNWRNTLEGEWMIKFYAPWCPACQANDADFKSFSEWSDDLGIQVATVDITKEPGLSGRFMVTALPTFYHGLDGTFRRYTGSRDSETMHEFIQQRYWANHEPISNFRHPDSISMTIMSWLFKTSIVVKTLHETLTESYGLSEWASYVLFAVGTVATGLILGMLIVFFVDIISPVPGGPQNENSSPIEEVEDEPPYEPNVKKRAREEEEEEDEESKDESDVSENASQSSHASQSWETIGDSELTEIRKRNVGGENENTAAQSTD